jgi:hypothetical protein
VVGSLGGRCWHHRNRKFVNPLRMEQQACWEDTGMTTFMIVAVGAILFIIGIAAYTRKFRA